MRIRIHCAEIGVPPDEGMRKFTANLLHLHTALGEKYRTMVQYGFEQESEPDGTPWQSLSPVTANRKITKKGKKRGFHPILRVSGRLANVHVEAREDHVTIGSNLSYAAIHQFGGMAGKNRKVRIPARPWLFGRDGGIPQKFRDALLQMVKKELDRCLS